MKVEDLSMQIILYAGNAKAFLHEALHDARNGQWENTEANREKASAELLKAHKIQTKFLQKDAAEKLASPPILLIHAQDHLMTVMSEKDLIGEMIHMYKNQHDMKKQIEQLLQNEKRQEERSGEKL
ncbi:PTS lactose/cellobiose transporter subunit IIA [Sediminibacillus albus]|uniref:PTS system, cellobiose-specific IIA component n=1 Tax=Sediminibacillus albus TaxID=407036 RepID=A0A1G8Y511_9BACI|nr:PTS lactose/cellobiose transporter subunit IIA [Sediminibacillus albus]SDJ97932.1 PTS system, cellobiose-specific IIA component [Sediminibacillus albus]